MKAPLRPPAGGPTAGTTTAKADARQPTTQPYGGPNLPETADHARRWRRHGPVHGAVAEGFHADTEAVYGTLPGGSWIDPAAPRPPVGFRLRLPDAWTPVDLDPATSWAWVRSYVRERVDDAPQLARHQGRMRRVLGEFLDECRAQGTFVLRLLTGPAPGDPLGPGDLLGASLTLAWRRLAGTDHVDVDGIAQVLASAPPAVGEPAADRIVAVVELPTGPAAYLHTAQLAALPGSWTAWATSSATSR